MRIEQIMTEYNQAYEGQDLEIDHPVHPDWIKSGLVLMSDLSHYKAMEQRFQASTEQFLYLAHSLGSLSMYLDSKRATHEQANLHLLTLAANGPVSHDELQKYRNLAGRPERAGEYIVWFGRVATAAYANYFGWKDTYDLEKGKEREERSDRAKTFEKMIHAAGGQNSFAKISLDLGGRRQAGQWDITAGLDKWADNLRQQITEEEHSAEVTDKLDVAEQIRGYEVYPFYKRDADGLPVWDSTTATIRRRRREAVVRIPGLRQIVIIKQSTGWMQLSEVEDDRQRVVISEALNNWSKEEHGYENSPVARVAGKVFERAIEHRKRTREVIPIGAHYYMQASVDMPVVTG